jgi:hypothetical protein
MAEKSKVYFANPRRTRRGGICEKIRALWSESGMPDMIEKYDLVAIKMHFGEPGVTSYIRPIIVRTIVDLVKEAEGRPFLTDTTTLYKRRRHTADSYYEAMKGNGFTSETMGCPILVADGFRNNGVYVTLDRYYKLKEVKVAQLIYDADVMVSLAHVTFHGDTGIAGTIKNIAMGGTCAESKLKAHSSEAKPKLVPERCIKCGICVRICPANALGFREKVLALNEELCISCGDCIAACPSGAIRVPWGMAHQTYRGILDQYRAVISTFQEGKVGHINLALDITPGCDCQAPSDTPMVPNIGVLASKDGLACDKATHDLINIVPGIPGTKAEEKGALEPGSDKFKALFPSLNMDELWELASKAGMGSLEYELIDIEKEE